MPRILYGTAWKKEQTERLVAQALGIGFRGIDTACQPKHYDEPGVGRSIAAAVAAGLDRADLYVQTRFTPVDGHDPRRIPYDPRALLDEQVRQSCRASLANLGLACLDRLVLHSPLDTPAETETVWRTFEALVEEGHVREIGLSHWYDLPTFRDFHERARIKPAMLQNRFFAKSGYDREIRAFCQTNGVIYQSFWTLTANPHLLSHSTLRSIAKRHGFTPEQLLFRALTQLDVVPLSGTTSQTHMRDDLAIFDVTLSDDDVRRVAALFV